MTIELSDHFTPSLLPLFRLKPAFLYHDGLFSPLQRAWQRYRSQPDNIRFLLGQLRNSWPLVVDLPFELNLTPAGTADSPPMSPAGLLENFASLLSADLGYVNRTEYQTGNFSFSTEGESNGIYIHPTATIAPLAHLDATEGPIVIGPRVRVSAFSLLKGPLVVEEGAVLDRVFLSHSRIGVGCRLGGEISHSFFGNYSNKHHEGFVGHSLIGDWVNLGALTTTSDLKNNYGEVRLQYRNITESTGTIKFGSIIGDYAKTAIGTLLNTGTIIDFGCLLYEGRPTMKYYPPFFWGGEGSVYRIERFLIDAEKIMARRQKPLGAALRQAITAIYEAEFQQSV